mgnify:CR=1 FL=1|jgi:hypothetical protein
MDQENLNYLDQIAERVTYYYSIRKKAIRYIMENQIRDAELGINLVLMSAVWAAHQRKEEMTEESLLILFGLSKSTDDEVIEQSVLVLQPEHEQLTLNEIFDQTVESFNQ